MRSETSANASATVRRGCRRQDDTDRRRVLRAARASTSAQSGCSSAKVGTRSFRASVEQVGHRVTSGVERDAQLVARMVERGADGAGANAEHLGDLVLGRGRRNSEGRSRTAPARGARPRAPAVPATRSGWPFVVCSGGVSSLKRRPRRCSWRQTFSIVFHSQPSRLPSPRNESLERSAVANVSCTASRAWSALPRSA